MNALIVPEIVKSKHLFASCAQEAANYVLQQPFYVIQPIAAYGACVEANIPPGREKLVDFMHAMFQARMQTFTGQLNDPLYANELTLLEDTIALNVHLATSPSCSTSLLAERGFGGEVSDS